MLIHVAKTELKIETEFKLNYVELLLEILRNYDAKWIVRGLKRKKLEGESHGYLLRQTTNS